MHFNLVSRIEPSYGAPVDRATRLSAGNGKVAAATIDDGPST
jgi:hypothetical protein